MSDDLEALANFDGVSRLFPLPNLVFYPQVIQGLHIFEPRYRDMTADALDGDKLITLVLLEEGWEEAYDEQPPVEQIGCLGRIVRHNKLPDGRYDLRLRGLSRVKIVEELRTGKTYRSARVETIPDMIPDDLSRLTRLRRTLAEVIFAQFEPESPARAHLAEMFESELPLGPLCDMLAYALPLPLILKQRLLEQPHVDGRAELMIRALSEKPPQPPSGRKFPPDFSQN